MKVLIAYFSRRGQNYVSGNIKHLDRGNTEIVAAAVKDALEAAGVEADLFHIDTVHAYPEDYEACTRVSRDELHAGARPALTDMVPDMEEYDTVVLGYPNWWGTAPMAVHTFLEAYDFSGKRIIPFCTHEGSGLGRSEDDVKSLAAGAKVVPGVAIRGSRAAQARQEVETIVRSVTDLA